MIKAVDSRKNSTSSTSTTVKNEEQEERGRKLERESSDVEDAEDVHSGDDDKDPSKKGKPERKRKRSRKGQDKKYPCPTEGCGKSYSRAEHLYRHQLNRERDLAASIRDTTNVEFQIPRSKSIDATIRTAPGTL